MLPDAVHALMADTEASPLNDIYHECGECKQLGAAALVVSRAQNSLRLQVGGCRYEPGHWKLKRRALRLHYT